MDHLFAALIPKTCIGQPIGFFIGNTLGSPIKIIKSIIRALLGIGTFPAVSWRTGHIIFRDLIL
jgi:hypothetical protein